MIVIDSRTAVHLLDPDRVNGEGFKVRRERKEFDSIPHWVRPRLQNFIDAGLMTYEEVLPPAEKKAGTDTDPAPPPSEEETAGEHAPDAPAEAKRKRR